MIKEDPYKDYVNWDKKKNSKWSKVSKQIKPLHVIGIFIVFFGGNYAVTSGRFPGSLFWGIMISVVVLFLFLIY